MKKLKFNLGEGGFKGFLFRHVEKIVASVVLLMVLYLLYSGYSGYSKTALSEDPATVMSLANQMSGNIDRPNTWLDVEKQKSLGPPTYSVRVETQPVDTVAYEVRLPWNPPLLPSKTKRTDPKVLKALKAEAVAGYGALALAITDDSPDDKLRSAEFNRRQREAKDKLAKAEEAQKREILEAKKRAAEDRKAAQAAAAAAKGGQAAPPKKTPKASDRNQQERDIGQLLGNQPGAAPAGEVPFGGPGPFAEGHAEAEQVAEFRPVGTAIPKGSYFAAVTALVPYKSQWKEFQYCFKDADGFDPQRDTPKYRGRLVERQEEGQDKWVQLSNSQVIGMYQTFVADRPEEIADPRYVDSLLTMPLPPILKRDLKKFALHTEVPAYSLNDAALAEDAKPADGAEEKPEAKKNPEDIFGGEVMAGPGRGNGLRPGEGAPPAAFKGPRAGRGGEGGPGLSANSNVEPEVEYLLFRFFDFSVEPGKKYRYRVKLALEDPNNPKPPSTEVAAGPGRPAEVAGAAGAAGGSVKPHDATLAPEVLERLKDESAPKHLRVTEWSDPSDYVAVPGTQHLLAGSVTPAPKTSALIAEPEAKVILTVWDNELAVDVPLEADVRRGSTLDLAKDASVFHPATLENVIIQNYKFGTGAVVVDMRGGEPLPGVDKKNPGALTANGEVLIMNGDGELIACDEMRDSRAYRRIRPEGDKPKGPAGNGGPGAPVMEAGGGFDGGILGPPPGRGPAPVRPRVPQR